MMVSSSMQNHQKIASLCPLECKHLSLPSKVLHNLVPTFSFHNNKKKKNIYIYIYIYLTYWAATDLNCPMWDLGP